MLGVVLSGGQSTRMGKDKGLLLYRKRLWAEIAEEKLLSLNIPVRISVNPAQPMAYLNHFSPAKLIVDNPSLTIKGPLSGLLSVHLSAPEDDLFLLACDMILMEKRLLFNLQNALEGNDSAEAVIYTRDEQQEPLCGIYTASGLRKITSLLQLQRISKSSMKFILSHLKVLEIPLEKQDYHMFSNFNSSEDTKLL
ncbi:MAG: molybdenum cofactor guanylyltransferase [Pedobacter sp.]|jgi:molybdopterin-guanine dinucleotide biosynthesis protein A|uniref:molybdenum cofactor guanylyltransferase n=1 Tax=Pedobacter sp. TaxID=1411316 RepID=UPI003395AAFC